MVDLVEAFCVACEPDLAGLDVDVLEVEGDLLGVCGCGCVCVLGES